MKKKEPSSKFIVFMIIFVIVLTLSSELIYFFSSNIIVSGKEISTDSFYSILKDKFNVFSYYYLTLGIKDGQSYVKQFQGNFIEDDKTIISVEYFNGDKTIKLNNLVNQEETHIYYLDYSKFIDIERAIDFIGQNEAKSIDLKTIKEIDVSNDISYYNKDMNGNIIIEKGWFVYITYSNDTSGSYLINEEYNKVYSLLE